MAIATNDFEGAPDEPLEKWTKPLIKRGARPEYEMEQVLPGEVPDNPDTDPILDAHVHLGNIAFPHDPDMAVRYYNMGVRIGEPSLGKDFDGLLPWGCIDNRPFLRCLFSYGLCLWRFGRLRDAERVFARMLWLNPTDNQRAHASTCIR